MEKRIFGKLGFSCSAFGIGCMRLPEVKGAMGDAHVDEAEAVRMIRHAIDHGVEYVDTAYPYHNKESELVVGKALKDGYRERVRLATKLPVWLTHKPEDFDRYLDLQLKRLGVDHVDFYLLHAIDGPTFDRLKKLRVLDFLDRAVAQGKIRYPAFSFHGERRDFKKVIDAYDWSMCQIQLNLLDEDFQAGIEGMLYAAEKDVPVVVMEPLRGGELAQAPPPEVQAIWDRSRVKRSPAEWAFRWLYNFPQVATILSGVSTMEQLEDNLRIFGEAKAESMSREELDLVREVKEFYHRKIRVGCTGCNYCMPCPADVSIPDVFRLYNKASIYDAIQEYEKDYEKLVTEKRDPSCCVRCGRCEPLCPQGIPIMEKLEEAQGYFRKK
ncbi:aldo/keto reductase [Anaerotalea alkaliphila]|uniref:Aldo/keto reductase n=1 Tax=Anaerotalea alkaliphila TaxID=2662126 RepID=A0A7X5HX60_9FIRM|nr:aldo/keto reductase [Anaerotalea alkaliphila]NDL68275.1 aldo/keto reductase [Anaerotalea alkaliphila]